MIKGLILPVMISELVKECRDYLNQVGPRNRIKLVLVPEHYGSEGKIKPTNWIRLARTVNPNTSIAMIKSAKEMGEIEAYRAHEILPSETG